MKKKVVIWGIGSVWKKLKRTIEEKYEIIGYGDSNDNLYVNGSRVWSVEELGKIDKNSYDYILVTPYGVKREIIVRLLKEGIEEEKIIPYYGENRLVTLECAKYTQNAIVITLNNMVFHLRTFSDDAVFYEVFVASEYDIHCSSPYVVIDIGMNVGLTSIYYGMQPMCKRVYGFEPFPSTYLCAEENIRNCIGMSEKLVTCNVGLSNGKQELNLYYDLEDSESMSIVRQNNGGKREMVRIEDAGEVLAPVLEKENNKIIICKMDCEGSEYAIMESLEKRKLIDKIDIFLMEWHYVDDDRLTNYFERYNYTYMKNYTCRNMGVLRAWKVR